MAGTEYDGYDQEYAGNRWIVKLVKVVIILFCCITRL